MKIAVYIPTASFFVGGGEVVPLMQAKFLKKLGYDLEVVVLEVNKESEYFTVFKKENPDLKINYLKSPIENIESIVLDHKLGHKLYFLLSRIFSEECCKNKYEIVISHYAPASFSVPKGIKEILFLHGVPEETDLVNEAACLAADKLVAVSQSVADGWSKMFGMDVSIEVVHNGIDASKFIPDQSINKETDILYIGRLIEIKGVQHLIKAVEILRDRYNFTKLKVSVYGKGPYENQLRQLVKDSDLSDLVQFLGYAPTEQLTKLYLTSKIYVFPSYAKEGVLTTMLESAASGGCIVSANCCGMKEFIKDKENGILFEPENPEQLAEKINLLLKNNQLRVDLGSRARKDVLESWTWEFSINKLKKVIEALV